MKKLDKIRSNTWPFSLMYFSVFMVTGILLGFLLSVIPALANLFIQLILSVGAFYFSGYLISRCFEKRMQHKMKDPELKTIWLQSSTFINTFQIIALIFYIPTLQKLGKITPSMLFLAFMFSVLVVFGLVYLSLRLTNTRA